MRVPRATIRPRERVVWLPSSSEEEQIKNRRLELERVIQVQNMQMRLTTHGLLHVVEDEVHELVKALESSSD